MNARELEQNAVALRTRRRLAVESAPLALLAAALAPAAWVVAPSLGLALAVGAALQCLLAAAACVRRYLLLERLALEPDAHQLPEVRAFGARLVLPRRRARLARSIRTMVAEAFRPDGRFHALFLVDRVAVYARDLEAIARDLVSPSVAVDPVSVARCTWLLTQAAQNPLYDRRIPIEDLGSILRRIRAGMHPVTA